MFVRFHVIEKPMEFNLRIFALLENEKGFYETNENRRLVYFKNRGFSF